MLHIIWNLCGIFWDLSISAYHMLHVICSKWHNKILRSFLFEFCINIAFSSGWLSAVKAKLICFSKAHEYTVCPLYEIVFMPHCAYDSDECFKIVGIIECRSSRNRFKNLSKFKKTSFRKSVFKVKFNIQILVLCLIEN